MLLDLGILQEDGSIGRRLPVMECTVRSCKFGTNEAIKSPTKSKAERRTTSGSVRSMMLLSQRFEASASVPQRKLKNGWTW